MTHPLQRLRAKLAGQWPSRNRENLRGEAAKRPRIPLASRAKAPRSGVGVVPLPFPFPLLSSPPIENSTARSYSRFETALTLRQLVMVGFADLGLSHERNLLEKCSAQIDRFIPAGSFLLIQHAGVCQRYLGIGPPTHRSLCAEHLDFRRVPGGLCLCRICAAQTVLESSAASLRRTFNSD